MTLGSRKTRLYKVSRIYAYLVNKVWQIKCKVSLIQAHYRRIQFLIKLGVTNMWHHIKREPYLCQNNMP